jgi:phosphoglycolate phosphatase
MSKIVVFDLDGTLAETAPDLVATLNVVLGKHGVAPVPYESARDLIGAGARALLERGLQLAGKKVGSAQLDGYFDDFLAHYSDNLCIHTHLFEGVEPALHTLKQEGYCLAVCTNKITRHAVAVLEGLNVASYFSAIFGRDSVPEYKPHPNHLLATITAAGGDATRAIMVGDSETDILTARAANIPSIVVPFGYTAAPIHTYTPDVIIPHFRDLVPAVRELHAPLSKRPA